MSKAEIDTTNRYDDLPTKQQRRPLRLFKRWSSKKNCDSSKKNYVESIEPAQKEITSTRLINNNDDDNSSTENSSNDSNLNLRRKSRMLSFYSSTSALNIPTDINSSILRNEGSYRIKKPTSLRKVTFDEEQLAEMTFNKFNRSKGNISVNDNSINNSLSSSNCAIPSSSSSSNPDAATDSISSCNTDEYYCDTSSKTSLIFENSIQDIFSLVEANDDSCDDDKEFLSASKRTVSTCTTTTSTTTEREDEDCLGDLNDEDEKLLLESSLNWDRVISENSTRSFSATVTGNSITDFVDGKMSFSNSLDLDTIIAAEEKEKQQKRRLTQWRKQEGELGAIVDDDDNYHADGSDATLPRCNSQQDHSITIDDLISSEGSLEIDDLCGISDNEGDDNNKSNINILTNEQTDLLKDELRHILQVNDDNDEPNDNPLLEAKFHISNSKFGESLSSIFSTEDMLNALPTDPTEKEDDEFHS